MLRSTWSLANRLHRAPVSLPRTMSSSSDAGKRSPDAEDLDVVQTRVGTTRVFTLNRPSALNALNLSMVRKMTPQIQVWENSEGAKSIIIRGKGSRAFCAGGDIKSIWSDKEHPHRQADFFREEYRLNHFIATMKTPYIALINGITMGGGVGLSVHGPIRIATESTVFAMPETAIGFFPDVGGSFFLPRLEGALGMYLALTGEKLKGADVFHAGIATHIVPESQLDAIVERLSFLEISKAINARNMVEEFSLDTIPPFTLADKISTINTVFSEPTVERMISRLEQTKTDFAAATLGTMMKRSPTSLKVTRKLMEYGATMSISDCLRMEYRVARRFTSHPDFYEGVRAVLVDKDNKPQWKPATLAEVSDRDVARFFEPLNSSVGEEELDLINDRDFVDYPTELMGLPQTKEIRRALESGTVGRTAEDVEEHFMDLYVGKVGVKEKVRDVISRHCDVNAKNELQWRSEKSML